MLRAINGTAPADSVVLTLAAKTPAIDAYR